MARDLGLPMARIPQYCAKPKVASASVTIIMMVHPLTKAKLHSAEEALVVAEALVLL
jgi:hypothetical protein